MVYRWVSFGCLVIVRSGAPDLGQKIDTNGRLVHVVERVVHESCNQRSFAHCCEKLLVATSTAGLEASAFDIPLCSPRNTNLAVGISMTDAKF